MKVMTDTAKSASPLAQLQQEENVAAAANDEKSLTEVFEQALDVTQDSVVTEAASLEEQDCKGPLKQKDEQKDEQSETQQEGRTSSSPAAGSPSVKTQDWKPGSRCRAVYSGDGLVYPAVVLWVKGQRCYVRYDDYNNEEVQDLGGLLNIDELHGPSRATAKQGGRRTGGPSRREEKQGERGAERRSAWRDDQYTSSARERLGLQGKEEKRREGGDKPTHPSFPFFPPFPPQSAFGDAMPSIPPPPPFPWAFGGKDSAGTEAASSMLMLWYMCGFHTGSYMTQNAFKPSPRD